MTGTDWKREEREDEEREREREWWGMIVPSLSSAKRKIANECRI